MQPQGQQLLQLGKICGWYLCADICIRGFLCGGVGPLTPEELALGFDRFPQAKQAEGGENVPGEEDVLNIAAAWGVDPRFEKTTYPPSAGWLCTI